MYASLMSFGDPPLSSRAIIESFIFYGRITLGDRSSTLFEKINFAKDEKPYRPATALVKQLF
jgi:hypothetical protein